MLKYRFVKKQATAAVRKFSKKGEENILAWKSLLTLGSVACLGMWLSLPEERKVKLIQQAHAWHYNLFDLKEEVYLKTRTRWSERKKDSAIAAEGLSLVLGEYAKMTKLQLQTLTEEVRYRLATALECGQKAYLKKKAELETLSQSYRT